MEQQILPTGPCTLCLKPGFYHYCYCFLRREGHGDGVYTSQWVVFRLDSAHSEVLLEKCSWFRKSRRIRGSVFLEKDCEACVFPQLTNRQVLLEKLRFIALHAFPAVRQTVIFWTHTPPTDALEPL